MFFGPPRHATRQYDDVFRGRTNKETLRNIFNCFANKVIGDMMASLALLLNAYLYVLLQIEIADHKKALVLAHKIPHGFNDKKGEYKKVFDQWDDTCHGVLFSVFTGWNNYSKPIISDGEFNTIMSTMKRVCKSVWSILANLRVIKPNQKRRIHGLHTKNGRFCLKFSHLHGLPILND